VKAYTVPCMGACNTLLDNDIDRAVMLDFLANLRTNR
jgi:hypothetical protein